MAQVLILHRSGVTWMEILTQAKIAQVLYLLVVRLYIISTVGKCDRLASGHNMVCKHIEILVD